MKKIVSYEAVDGKVFDNEKDCLEYEQKGIAFEIQDTYKEIQYLKSGVLADEDKLFAKAKAAYRKACTERMSEAQRVQAITNYSRISTRYKDAKTQFQKLKNRVKFLKEKEAEINNKK